MTNDYETVQVEISASDVTLPTGWHWGRHFAAGARGCGYYAVRDCDGQPVAVFDDPTAPALTAREFIRAIHA